MSVEHDFLNARQQRIVRIDVAPPHLHHADLLIAEVIHHLAQAIRPRQKVRIKDCQQFPARLLHRVFQRARLETRAICAMQVVYVVAFSFVLSHRRFRDVDRLIG